MYNPILANLRQPNHPGDGIKSLLNGNPAAICEQMLRSNPQFAQFAKQIQGKSMEQACQEFGIDPEMVRRFLK